MGFVRIFWKNNVQEAYLPKMSISRQIVSEIVAQLFLENSIQTLLNFFRVDPKKNNNRKYVIKTMLHARYIRGVVWSRSLSFSIKARLRRPIFKQYTC